MKNLLACGMVASVFLFPWTVRGATKVWVTGIDGVWTNAEAWSPPGAPAAGDDVVVTNDGTYTLTLWAGAGVGSVLLGGAVGTQTLAIAAGILNATNGNVRANGRLVITDGGIRGNWRVDAGGELRLEESFNKNLGVLTLLNEGVLRWLGGNVLCSWSGITNWGEWVIDGGSVWDGSSSQVQNAGTVRKTGTSTGVFAVSFENAGDVAVEEGTLGFRNGTPTRLGGHFEVSAAGGLELRGQLVDAGGVFGGPGPSTMLDGTLTLETNTLPGLKLAGGQIRLGPNFQAGGAITNLTLEGAMLTGTNTVGLGRLSVLTGTVTGELTICPEGKLGLGDGFKRLSWLNLINHGTIHLLGGGELHLSGTTVSNRGEWLLTASSTIYGDAATVFSNEGMVRRDAEGITTFYSVPMTNTGVVCAEGGTIDFRGPLANPGGTLRLLGGQFGAFSPLWLAGGRLEGFGRIGLFVADSGIIAPGTNGTGTLTFLGGLNLSNTVTLLMDVDPGNPGGDSDRIVVNGALRLNDCLLRLEPLPMVAVGSEFTLVENSGFSLAEGLFEGIPNGGLFTASGQLFRVFYDRGTGNDIILVRDDGGVRLTIRRTGLPGQCSVQGRGTNYANYAIQTTTNLSNPVWEQVAVVQADGGGVFTYFDTGLTNDPARFFRSLGP